MITKDQIHLDVQYKVINGPYKGFVGTCVSVDMHNNYQVILVDDKANGRACKVEEIEININNEAKISE
jgi:transcription antitermination factor NusG